MTYRHTRRDRIVHQHTATRARSVRRGGGPQRTGALLKRPVTRTSNDLPGPRGNNWNAVSFEQWHSPTRSDELAVAAEDFLQLTPGARVEHIGFGQTGAARLQDAVAHGIQAFHAVRIGADDDRDPELLGRRAVHVV